MLISRPTISVWLEARLHLPYKRQCPCKWSPISVGVSSEPHLRWLAVLWLTNLAQWWSRVDWSQSLISSSWVWRFILDRAPSGPGRAKAVAASMAKAIDWSFMLAICTFKRVRWLAKESTYYNAHLFALDVFIVGGFDSETYESDTYEPWFLQSDERSTTKEVLLERKE